MKHLLNNLTEEEKNAIRAQHTGGKEIFTENFKRLIKHKGGTVNTLIIEAEASAQQFKSQAQTAAGCFSEQNTPKLYKLAKGMGLGALAIGAFALTYFSAGAADGMSGGMAVTTGIFASGAAIDNLYKAISEDKSSFEKELRFLYDCVF